MKISVIIATFNRRTLLVRTLPPILQQTFDSEEHEVIVVVDGSTDRTTEFLSSIPHRGNLRVIEQPNRGQAAAINAGLRECPGDLLLSFADRNSSHELPRSRIFGKTQCRVIARSSTLNESSGLNHLCTNKELEHRQFFSTACDD